MDPDGETCKRTKIMEEKRNKKKKKRELAEKRSYLT